MPLFCLSINLLKYIGVLFPEKLTFSQALLQNEMYEHRYEESLSKITKKPVIRL